ncbi:hypothetical protein G195_000588 [Phytophthora kernoviae 00238/432]|uniref:glycine dehydrogenase (aminomethyl-transferring) n=1 Tax=Phytophthora kernoviae 00238/432 TaxID=1284355 RepID=A0A8J4SWF2_9STRA|nr:hypothetical protein G195_000588 [Phytophthora kernoviae 00238/432]
MLVVNASNIDKDWAWLQQHMSPGVTMINDSEQTALLALQGPLAVDILAKVTDTDVSLIEPFRFVPNAKVCGVTLLLSRTGYTGEDGFELYVPAEQAAVVWNGLMQAGEGHGLVPTGLGARDTLRFEAKLPLYGQELSATISPLEAGVGMFVKLNAGPFIGHEALLQQKNDGPARKLVGIEVLERGIPRPHYPIYAEGVQIGEVTTGTQSPTLKRNLGLALIDSKYAALGTPLEIEIRGKKLKAEVVKTPFHKRTRMAVANASMYDGATAFAEAGNLAAAATRRKQLIVSRTVHPESRQVLKAYAHGLNLEIVEIGYQNGVTDWDALQAAVSDDTAAVMIQSPNFFGAVENVKQAADLAHAHKSLLVVSANPLSLGQLEAPGKLGADIVVGDAQPLGIAASLGGPTCGYFAVSQAHMRRIPGRIVGQTTDRNGKRGFVLTLQAREQHIRRSCTMKYNPKINEDVARYNGFAKIHPYQHESSIQGALELLYTLQNDLAGLTGMDAVTLQPAAGAHGEWTGLMMIRAYHEGRGEQRTKVIVPDSSHGTNPASATVAGFETVTIPSRADGLVDLDVLRAAVGSDTAALMLTNPNTLGLFEKDIQEIASIVHEAGGLLYYDGANSNAIMGITRPGDMGFDVVHLNLHKTMSTPHGGGGPGAGPVGVKSRLIPFLPKPMVIKNDEGIYALDREGDQSIGRVKAYYGNFGILVRAYAYIRTYGPEGLRRVSECAVLNANYMMARLAPYYEIPYPGVCKHEFVMSGRGLKQYGVRTLDVAKRLLDFGYHPPTVYFPLNVEECIMIEPTETESKETLDGFIDTMIRIAKEAEETPELVLNAPYGTPVTRLDETTAARKPVLNCACS